MWGSTKACAASLRLGIREVQAETRRVRHANEGTYNHRERAMLHYAIIFFVIAIIAAVLGFGVIAGTAAWIAKVLFIVFLILAVLSFLKKSA